MVFKKDLIKSKKKYKIQNIKYTQFAKILKI